MCLIAATIDCGLNAEPTCCIMFCDILYVFCVMFKLGGNLVSKAVNVFVDIIVLKLLNMFEKKWYPSINFDNCVMCVRV